MKQGISIGTVVIIGLVIWWLTQRQKPAQASGRPASEVSEYEKLHTTVPITASTERLFEVYGGE